MSELWTPQEKQDFWTCWNLNEQIAQLIAQQRAVWDRFCKSREREPEEKQND